MSWEFFVGQKVVCVDADADTTRYADDLCLLRGAIYTIRKIVASDGKHGTYPAGAISIFLNEVDRQACSCCGKVIPYRATRFRPLESKAISLFRSIAQGVTDGKPVVPDTDAPVEHEPVMPEFVGRPLLLVWQ